MGINSSVISSVSLIFVKFSSIKYSLISSSAMKVVGFRVAIVPFFVGSDIMKVFLQVDLDTIGKLMIAEVEVSVSTNSVLIKSDN